KKALKNGFIWSQVGRLIRCSKNARLLWWKRRKNQRKTTRPRLPHRTLTKLPMQSCHLFHRLTSPNRSHPNLPRPKSRKQENEQEDSGSVTSRPNAADRRGYASLK